MVVHLSEYAKKHYDLQFKCENYDAWYVCSVAQSCPTVCNLMNCVTHQPPLSMEFSWQEYQSGLSFPPPRYLPDPGFEPMSPVSPAPAGRFFITVLPGDPQAYESPLQKSLPNP